MTNGWQPELDELARRQVLAGRLGGEERVARQRAAGRLTVRERIDALLDGGSFQEVGSLTAAATTYAEDGTLTDLVPANLVVGQGRVGGRRVVVAGDDFTVRGGAADASLSAKQVLAERMAGEMRMPLVRLLDGTGGGGSVKSLEDAGRTYVPENPGWQHVVANLARVPVVALALGPVAGLGAARLVTSHIAVIVKDIAQVFVAGPAVVDAGMGRAGRDMTDAATATSTATSATTSTATSATTSIPTTAAAAAPRAEGGTTAGGVAKEELGGWRLAARAGTVDLVADTETDAFALVRKVLSYLPQHAWAVPPRQPRDERADPPDRRDAALREIVPRDRRAPYDVRGLLRAVFDRGSVLEVGRAFAPSTVTALARLDGHPVAVLASDPRVYGGGMTADGSDKLTRFVDLAETFSLPVVHLVDQPGFVIGAAAEKASTIRHGSRALAAVYQTTMPWASVLVRRVYGVAGAAHRPHHRYTYRLAWPSGDWGSLPLEGGLEVAFKRMLAEAGGDAARLKAEIAERLEAVRSPFRTAEAFLVDELIDPADTRPMLCDWVAAAYDLLESEPRTPQPGRTPRP